MSGWLKATLMLLGAVCVLLVAGAFPVLGAPAVFRGGLMQLLGLAVGAVALWGGWRIASGLRVQFVFGLVCCFFAVSGVIAAWMYGCKAVEHALLGGVMWFGALGMACTAVVGVLFAVIFGYFVRGVMRRTLWLAAAHWSAAFIVFGAFADYCLEKTAIVYAGVGSDSKITQVTTATGESLPLEFALQVDDFAVSHYDASAEASPQMHHRMILRQDDTYAVCIWRQNMWAVLPEHHWELQGDSLVMGGQRFSVADMLPNDKFEFPCKLISEPVPQGVNVQGSVKEYRAGCRVFTEHRGRPETRHEVLRVNEPIACKDWHVYLLSYDYNPITNRVSVILQARKAPGRWFVMVGMVGLMLSTACWCWWRRETLATDGKEEMTA